MIREKKIRNKSWYVVIDIISELRPKSKPSKLWSEYKKRVGKDLTVVVTQNEFEASNGRVYELDCVSGKDVDKIKGLFSPKKGVKKEESAKDVEPVADKKAKAKAEVAKAVDCAYAKVDAIMKKCHAEVMALLK